MKFASSYEPGEYESDIYGAWEASGVFAPSTPTVPVDDDGDGVDDRSAANTYSIVMTTISPSAKIYHIIVFGY